MSFFVVSLMAAVAVGLLRSVWLSGSVPGRPSGRRVEPAAGAGLDRLAAARPAGELAADRAA